MIVGVEDAVRQPVGAQVLPGTLGVSFRLRDAAVHIRPSRSLHESVPFTGQESLANSAHEAELGLRAPTLAIEPRFETRGVLMRVICTGKRRLDSTFRGIACGPMIEAEGGFDTYRLLSL